MDVQRSHAEHETHERSKISIPAFPAQWRVEYLQRENEEERAEVSMLSGPLCWRHDYHRDGTREHGLRHKFNPSLLFDFVYDLSGIYTASGVGRENRVEHHRIAGNDSFSTTDIRNHAFLRLSNIGPILFCHNTRDWSIRGGYHDDFKLLSSHESKDARLDEEAGHGMVGRLCASYWYAGEAQNSAPKIHQEKSEKKQAEDLWGQWSDSFERWMQGFSHCCVYGHFQRCSLLMWINNLWEQRPGNGESWLFDQLQDERLPV